MSAISSRSWRLGLGERAAPQSPQEEVSSNSEDSSSDEEEVIVPQLKKTRATKAARQGRVHPTRTVTTRTHED